MIVLDLSNAITATMIAYIYHEGQVDKGGNDYILHPLRVMSNANTINEKIVAVLHDIIEDTSCSFEYLRCCGFSNEILNAIDALTRREDETYFEFINRCKENELARIVKILDIQDNMDLTRIDNPNEQDLKRVEKYAKALKILNET